MNYLFILLILIFPFGQLVRWDLGNSVVLHLNDLAVALVLIFGLRKISDPLIRPLLLFLACVLLSLILNLNNFSPLQLFVAALYPLRFFAYAGLYFAFAKQKIAQRWLIIAAVIIAVFGLLQYILVPDVSFLKALDWDDHYFRLVGAHLDPGFTGALLVLGLLLTPLPVKVLIYVAMALTYSRATYLMYLVSFAVLAFYQKSVKIFLVAAAILGLTLLVLPKTPGEGTKLDRETSLWARVHNWQETLVIWQKSPLFGVGFNTYRYVSKTSPQSHSGGADSSLLLVLATSGTVGLFTYFYLLKKMWSQGNLLFRASFLGVLVHSFFNNTLFYPWVMEWLWLLLVLS